MNPETSQGASESEWRSSVNVKPTKFAAQIAHLSAWMHGLLPDAGGPGGAEEFVMVGNPKVVG